MGGGRVSHPLNEPFIAREIYLTYDGMMHSLKNGEHRPLHEIECSDWKTFAEDIFREYPDTERIEFATWDKYDNGTIDFSTLVDWEIVCREGHYLLLRVEDCESAEDYE